MGGEKKTIEYHLKRPIEPWRLDLIAKYMPAALRCVPWLQRKFPGQDVEAMAMTALYIAAFTYKPGGRMGFYHWFRIKVAGQSFGFRRKALRLANLGVKVMALGKHDPRSDPREWYTDGNPAVVGRRRVILIPYRGEVRTQREWSDITGLRESTISQRLSRGFSIHDALTLKVGSRRKTNVEPYT